MQNRTISPTEFTFSAANRLLSTFRFDWTNGSIQVQYRGGSTTEGQHNHHLHHPHQVINRMDFSFHYFCLSLVQPTELFLPPILGQMVMRTIISVGATAAVVC